MVGFAVGVSGGADGSERGGIAKEGGMLATVGLGAVAILGGRVGSTMLK